MPKIKKTLKIAIYGGTFDPIHRAHLEIASYAKAQFAFDKFYWVPTSTSPFKKSRIISPSYHRVEMLKMCLPEGDKVSFFEIARKRISYTKDTVHYFRQKFPEAELYLIIGSDHLKLLHKWDGIDYIAQETQIIVARRSKTFSRVNIKKFRAILLDNELIDVSATEIRNGDFSELPGAILDYIAHNFLYLDCVVRATLSLKRAQHSFNVASLAGEYAKLNHFPWAIAYHAGLIHDITKEWTEKEHEIFFKRYYPFKLPPKYQYHEKTAALWYKYVYQGKEEKIYQAIACHTSTCSGEVDLLSKIIFCADKLASGRKFNKIQSIRQLALENINKGFIAVLKVNLAFLKEKNVLSTKTAKRYEELLND